MPWYRAGSVAVTNGSAIVTGAGTDFVGNAQAGEVFLGPDGRAYEISAVQSATQLTIIPNYQGASAGGQAYGIQPTASFARDLALGAAQLLNTFGAVRDGIGQGLIPDGTLAVPAIRFSADQDTGIRRIGANAMALVTGGIDRLVADTNGGIAIGGYSPTERLHVYGNIRLDAMAGKVAYAPADVFTIGGDSIANYGLTVGAALGGGNIKTVVAGYGGVVFGSGGSERARIDQDGNWQIGVTGNNYHRIAKSGPKDAAGTLLTIEGTAITAAFYDVGAFDFGSASAAAMKLGRNGTTNRSLNAPGTLNAGGADYAEYMLKAAGCGIIAKGDVCGVDRDGKLTKTWADAISFVVKSTDPSLVGGDTWAAHLPSQPEQPGAEPVEPAAPLPPAEDADEAALAAWRDAMAAHPARLASYQAEHAAWQQADAAYAAELAAWEDELETARQCVDRIAFCGQVPANVTGDFEVGDYIIAAANGAGIKAVAVKPDDMTLPQYMRRIGKVWEIRDGRAWIDVQHG